MSAGPQPVVARIQDQALLGELLHTLSQPLTSLRCSLELSGEGGAGQQQDVFSAALAQTDRVIGVVRLMREYLDAESTNHSPAPVVLGPVLRGVVADLSPVARERGVQLQLTGGCSATVALAETRLRLALQYLIGVVIERQARQGEVVLRLEQARSESELRCGGPESNPKPSLSLDRASVTLHRAQLVIAQRILESAGASLEFRIDDPSGFLLHLPHAPRSSSSPLA